MTTGRTTAGRPPAWAWALALLAIAAAVAPLVHYWLTNPADQRLVDLDVYRTGGWALLTGLPVYGVITPAPQLLPFTYPPVAAMLAVPLAEMSWPAAQWVWTAGIVAALVVTGGCAFRPLLRSLPGRWAAPPALALLTAACAYLMPIRDQVRFGQVDLFLLLLCLLDCVVRRPRWPRGMLIGIATAVKLTPGVFLIYLAITGFPRRGGDGESRRAFFLGALTAALLTVLPFLVIFDDARDYWFGALLDSERLGANAATTNQSLRGMLLRLYLPGPFTAVIWLAAVAVIGWYGFRAARRAHRSGDTMTAVALTGLMAVLLSPVAWIHHIAWVVIVVAALAGTGRDRVRSLVAAGVWLFYVLPVPWWGVSIKALEIPVLSPVVGKIVQDGFGLGAVALVWILGSWLPRRVADRPQISRSAYADLPD
ncbi:glycosyltransferase 87 family protein [Microbispora oryzae]|uniref:glycosyltransferase 87 family protein n=1 Tax=Microbispora oryzae TaxID=2806554 RepID=UPI0027DD1395|nr:glycosyltransferase 87 family protein [Microbispora oryzae]